MAKKMEFYINTGVIVDSDAAVATIMNQPLHLFCHFIEDTLGEPDAITITDVPDSERTVLQ